MVGTCIVIERGSGLRSLRRWDCFWYGSIFLHGYDAVPVRNPAGDAAYWAFYPLFPLVAGLWHRMAGFGFRRAGREWRTGLNEDTAPLAERETTHGKSECPGILD
jgi:hypothetical protein